MAKSEDKAPGDNPLASQQKPSEPQSPLTGGQSSESQDVDNLKRQLAHSELRAAQLEAENKALVEAATAQGSVTGNFPRSMATTKGKNTFKFSVAVANKPELPKLEIVATDESEAIRLYTLKAQPGKVLDTVNCSWKVECLEAVKRREVWQAARERRAQERGFAPTAAAV